MITTATAHHSAETDGNHRRCRRLMCDALQQVLTAHLRDELAERCDDAAIRQSAADAIDHLIARPSARPDPRRGTDDLARALQRACRLQMIREAAALMLMFDDALDVRRYRADQPVDLLACAVAIGGLDCLIVWANLFAPDTEPQRLYEFTQRFARVLNTIAGVEAPAG